MKALEITNVQKHFGDVHAVDGISFSVEPGEIFGFLGPNGAGKSTTLKCVVDLIRPDEGNISIFGLDSVQDSMEIRRRTAYLAGDVHVEEKWSGQVHIDFASKLGGNKSYAMKLAKRFQYDPAKKAKKLSSGNRQKLGLILALMMEPELLILDEPTTGLDPMLQNETYSILEEEQSKGTTIIMSSHNLNEVERVCDRVGIIKQGKMVATESIVALKAKRLYSIEASFKETVDDTALAAIEGVEVLNSYNHTKHLSAKGDIAAILASLHELQLEDIEVTRARLEDIFMEYYQ